MKKISRVIKFSIVSLGGNNNKRDERITPSKQTIELIKHIHCGFNPFDQSIKRWNSEI